MLKIATRPKTKAGNKIKQITTTTTATNKQTRLIAFNAG